MDIFSKNLFWDVDENDLDIQQRSRFIIERVLMRGRIQDWLTINRIYGLDKIKEEAIRIRYLDKVTLNFCSTYFHIPKSKFVCYNQPQSIQQLWDY